MIAAEVTIASSDFGHLQPIVSIAQNELKASGVTDTRWLTMPDPLQDGLTPPSVSL